MWISEQRGQQNRESDRCIVTGPVTVPERPVAVWLEGERRGVECYGPGGYYWMPELHQELLVLKNDEGEYYAVGAAPKSEQDRPSLAPGEIMIRTGKASLTLRPNGTVEIWGNLKLNGVPFP